MKAAAITGFAIVPERRDPRDFEMAGALAESLCLLNRWADAEPIWRRLLKAHPTAGKIWQALGTTLTYLSRFSEAIAAYRTALAYQPTLLEAHNNLIMLLDAHPSYETEAQDERLVWWTQHGADAYRARDPHHANDRDPARPLRVGYVSGDFRQHSAASIFGPIIAGHQDSGGGMTAVSYSTLPQSLYDPVTRGFQSWTEFHDISGWSDAQLVAHIRTTAIDVLVDLGGYAARNRLPAFAHKPAPIQLTAWGYATGVGWPEPAMDGLFAEPVVLPVARRASVRDRVIDLPCVLGYQGPTASPVGPLPCLTAAPTFGAFHRPGKINAAVLKVWADVLRAVPGSRLLCKGPGFTAPFQAWMESEMPGCFKALVFHPETCHGDHLDAYAAVDLQLDCWPQTAGVTGLEAAWMGVPTLTLVGDQVIQRTTASINTVLDLAPCIAPTRAAFVQQAVALVTTDRAWLRDVRADLRRRLDASPICTGYGDRVETAYRDLWRTWCATAA